MLHALALNPVDGVQTLVHLGIGGNEGLVEQHNYENGGEPALEGYFEAELIPESHSKDLFADLFLRLLLKGPARGDIHLARLILTALFCMGLGLVR